MTTYFVSRHPGAIEWAATQSFKVDALVTHLDITCVQAGDVVIGSLPVNLAAQVCARGADYWHLSLDLAAELRGREISATDMSRLGARVEQFEIHSVNSGATNS
jgi:CRISPR-associated protein Csx16